MLYVKAVDKEQWEEICSGLKWKEEKDEFKLWIGEQINFSDTVKEEQSVRVVAGKIIEGTLDPRKVEMESKKKKEEEENAKKLKQVAQETTVVEGVNSISLEAPNVETVAEMSASTTNTQVGAGGAGKSKNGKDREMQLSDADFAGMFGMTKDTFLGLAGWKQKNLKKKYGYF
ncbi:hypothetical protein TrLO_g15302 [Triparma laevis f. longispina]|uniref:HP domain-containing protein n=1 Tax=Triparma laevis f. longispina TaxID=1714387 RepID=A0A9W7FRI4_9STRA|nr:hypothetical protein TrLO_g15302 [Triparma laevis f. longispina]